MKRLLNLFCAVALVGAFGVACEKNGETGDEYYWSGGAKIWLTKNYGQMLVGFGNAQDAEDFVAATPEASLLGQTMALVDVRDGSVRKKVMTEKTATNRIHAYKYYGYDDAPFWPTGDIVMQLRKGVTPQEILTEFKIRGEIVRDDEVGVIVRLDDWGAIFDVANAIYESGRVDWCHPDFIAFIAHGLL